MTESEFRGAIVTEALTWTGTPYKDTGRVKGVAVNCAQLLYGVAKNAGVLTPDAPEPRWFSSQLPYHQPDERIVQYVLAYGAREIQESELGGGDIVVYKTGQAHGHAAIVIDWPTRILHSLKPNGCVEGHGTKEGVLAGKGRRYFTLWGGSGGRTGSIQN
jgi:cell wall-associated NlpC family hydrolase